MIIALRIINKVYSRIQKVNNSSINNSLVLLLILFLSITIFACNPKNLWENPYLKDIAVTGITITPSPSTVTLFGTLQLTSVVSPSNASNQSVTWTSSDTSLATVNSDGLVTGIKIGSATITATSVDDIAISSTCPVTINPMTECIISTSGSDTGAETDYTLLDGTTLTTIQTTDDIVTTIIFPTGLTDASTSTITRPLIFAETETTYELWNTVYTWAISNGYTFTNAGTCGSGGSGSVQQPVTGVAWQDAIVWCNAFTEYYNAHNGSEPDLLCVFYNDTTYTTPIRSTADTYILTPYIYDGISSNTNMANCIADGFRLPTSMEWEYAARYRGTDNVNTVLGYANPYYTKGNSASGAWTYWNDVNDTDSNSIVDGRDANEAVAVDDSYWGWNGTIYTYQSMGIYTSTLPVKSKSPNALGLYDMSGNVYEWTVSVSGSDRIRRGGSFYTIAELLQIYNENPYSLGGVNNCGFRVMRNK